MQKVNPNESKIKKVSINAEKTMLASLSEDQSLYIWDLRLMDHLIKFEKVNGYDFSPSTSRDTEHNYLITYTKNKQKKYCVTFMTYNKSNMRFK